MLLLVFIPVLIFNVSCTSTRWVVEDEPVIDESEGELIEAKPIVLEAAGPVPEQPVLSLEVHEVRETEYPERLQSRRYVQQYRPRYGIWAIGLGSSAALLTLAHTDWIVGESLSRDEQILVNSTAALVAGGSLLSMKPVGYRQDTGGTRLLAQTGTATRIDTVRVHEAGSQSISVRLYDETMLYDREIEVPVQAGTIDIDIVRELDIEQISREDPGDFFIEFEFEGREHRFSVAGSDILNRVVEVEQENAPLRSGPNQVSGNILTNVSAGVTLTLIDRFDDEWYEVERGVSSAYIHQSDAGIVWKPGGFAGEGFAFEDGGGFGDLDVEQDIPETSGERPMEVIIWANDQYPEQMNRPQNIERSIRLIEAYAEQRLGVHPQAIHTYRNPDYRQASQVFDADSSEIAGRQVAPDSTHLMVYYLGHALADVEDEPQGYLLSADYDLQQPGDRRINLKQWLAELAGVQTASTTVILETDFMGSTVTSELQSADNVADNLLFRELAAPLTDSHPRAAVMFAAGPGQSAGRYVSEDGRTNNYHGIFTYYLFMAMREEPIRLNELFNSVKRNVNFTSRRLHDRAQNPLLFGNTAIDWLLQPEPEQ